MENSIFSNDFYPTPKETIDLMVSGVDVFGKNILEPSAGNGNILDYLKNLGVKGLYSFEVNKDLATIAAKKSNFLGYDFLESKKEDLSHINIIIMNPPFSKGCEHILHAWAVAPEGCEIIAICNYETLDNTYTRKRVNLKRLISENGSAENLGSSFATAERKTGVEIGLVKLYKPVVSEGFDYSGFFMEDEPENGNAPGLMPYNEIREIVQRYIGALKCFDELKASADKMNACISPIGLDDGFSYSVGYKQIATTKEQFSKYLQKTSWAWIFKKLDLNKFVTSGVMKDINSFVEGQQKIPFTMKNIYRMLEIIVGTREQTMERATVEAFDKITAHHKENRHGLEGWKTNSHYLVNKTFIFPGLVKVGYSGEIDLGYSSDHKVDDINKVLCFLTGRDFNGMLSYYQRLRVKGFCVSIDGRTLTDSSFYAKTEPDSNRRYYGNPKEFKSKSDIYSFISEFKPGSDAVIFEAPEWGKWCEWDFFKVRCYKKGTVHFKFKDEKTWALFNTKAAQIKGFPLPEKI